MKFGFVQTAANKIKKISKFKKKILMIKSIPIPIPPQFQTNKPKKRKKKTITTKTKNIAVSSWVQASTNIP